MMDSTAYPGGSEVADKAERGSVRVDSGYARAALMSEFDVVQVVALNRPDRAFTGTSGVSRAPRIGDIGTICHEYAPGDSTATVAVEMVDANGYTVWLADFDRSELHLIR